jgi:hypothetical protein
MWREAASSVLQQQQTGTAGIDWNQLREMYLATPLRSPEAVQRKNLELYNPVAHRSPKPMPGETPVRNFSFLTQPHLPEVPEREDETGGVMAEAAGGLCGHRSWSSVVGDKVAPAVS